MAKIFNKMLNFVGWEADEEEELVVEQEEKREDAQKPQFTSFSAKRQPNKVVNIHTSSQFKVVIMQPETFEDAQDICNHLKDKKPVVINLEELGKDTAQRIIDFLSGSVYALDGNIQKVSAGIFLIAPNNVDIMGDYKEEFRNKGVLPWVR